MATDPQKRRAVGEVVRQHPGMSLAAVSPGIVVFLILWAVTNFWLALIVGVVAAGAGYYYLTRQK